ncbi:MAG: hypothetical protein J6D34_07195 [Atopobiaceae bacterium]|nr:hypothetical protein [Atopobiaceae bacterium]
MAELIDIRRVQIGPENMIAHVRISEDCPLMTSEDLEGTARVYRLLPHIVEHVCLGDAGETFRDAMGDTEVAHLLEHVTVELLAQTDLAGDMPAGRTWVDEVEDRTYQIELACPDDVLVAAALSCGVWILDWAYTGGPDPEPNVGAIVAGLVQLVENVGDEGEDLVIDYESAAAEADDEPLDDEPADEEQDGAAADEIPEEPEVTEPEQPTVVTEPVRPLWTPAPEVPKSARPSSSYRPARVEAPEVEEQIDRIMATIEMAPLSPSEVEADAAARAGSSQSDSLEQE